MPFMLDFHKHRKAAKTSGPALERRMLMLLVAAGVVALLMLGGGNPRTWRWLLSERQEEAAAPHVQAQPPHVVIARADKPSDDDASPSETSVDDDKTGDATAAGDEAYFPGVRADYLRSVRDDTVFRPQESDGWFHLFALLEHTSNQALVDASAGPVSYLQLAQQPSAYRGRVVTIHGIVRAAKHVVAPRNAFGVQGYYQLWLQPDVASDELLVLYAVALPDDFPLGDQTETSCTATGIFFKRWAYQSRGGIATAPLVIAKTVDWQPPAPTIQPPPAPPLAEQLLIAGAAALILAVLALAFVVRRSWGTSSRRRSDSGDAPSADRVSTAMATLENEKSAGAREP
jgi:hypothetical protein